MRSGLCSAQQIRQLAGMRVCAKPSGEIIESPSAQFREGWTFCSLISRTRPQGPAIRHSRMPIRDTGQATGRVAQDVIIREPDCGTLRGIAASHIEGGEDIGRADRLWAARAQEPSTGEDAQSSKPEEIDEDLRQRLEFRRAARAHPVLLTCDPAVVAVSSVTAATGTGRPVEIARRWM